MPADTRDPNDYLPLTPALFHVLLSLTDGEKHGYAIIQPRAMTVLEQGVLASSSA